MSAIYVQTALPIEVGAVEEVRASPTEEPWARSCPLCGARVRRSEYLQEVFVDDPYGEWAANLVTHYRHDHIAYYDRACLSSAYAREARWNSYDEFKAAVNNRAKRQLIRGILAAGMPLRDKYGLIGGFRRLEHNEPETESLVTAALARRRR